MDRIDFPGGFFSVPKKPAGKKDAKRVKKNRFHEFFSSEPEAEGSAPISLNTKELTQKLESALDRVHQWGEKLKEDPTLGKVLEYKEAVRSFLHLIINRCYRVNEKNSTIGILNRKKYIQIQVVDEKLERLAAEVMQGQREQLNILKRVDEIYGALVDLLR